MARRKVRQGATSPAIVACRAWLLFSRSSCFAFLLCSPLSMKQLPFHSVLRTEIFLLPCISALQKLSPGSRCKPER
jgi:hypothetical protein